MKPNGDIDVSKIPEYAKHLVKGGVGGIFVNGTTGEGVLSLSLQERKDLTEAWVKAGKDLTIMIQISGCSFRESQELAAHAQSLGVAAIGCLPNMFPKPRSVDELVEWCRQIAACAPSTPFFYYHIPGFSSVTLPMAEFLDKAAAAIPTLAGIKFSSADFGELAKVLAVRRRDGQPFKIFHGNDETFSAALALGLDSAVGSTYNFMPQVFLKLLRLNKEGKREEMVEIQEKITNMINSIFKFGFGVSALKPVMNIVSGLDLGPPRFPYLQISKEKEKELAEVLKKVDLELFN